MKLKVKMGGLLRVVSGESLFKAMWENTTSAPGFVALTPNMPATIIPIDLSVYNGAIKCKRDAFLAAISPLVTITIALIPTDSLLACCCSGMGLIMQNICGTGIVSYFKYSLIQ